MFWFGTGGGGSNGTELGGRTPFSEKEHYNHLSGALKTAAARRGDTDGEDGDIEDGDNGESKKNKGKQKRRSMRPAQREDSNNTLSTPGKSPSSELLYSRPVTPSGLNSNAHHTDSPHQYPPGGSATHVGGGSWDEGNTTLVSAAKVLKTAVLHDARNIKGKVASLKALAWNVNTSHEAKVFAQSCPRLGPLLMTNLLDAETCKIDLLSLQRSPKDLPRSIRLLPGVSHPCRRRIRLPGIRQRW